MMQRAMGVPCLGCAARQVPKGTHDWSKFITPDELAAILRFTTAFQVGLL